MRVPVLHERARSLEAAVQTYLLAAKEYTAAYGQKSPPKKQRAKEKKALPHAETPDLPLENLESDKATAESAIRGQLRALHWRVDAEVLKLYALPAELERELLDFFDGVARVGVPFAQKGYIPSVFREVQRLDDFLRITDEWEQTDDRRCHFIEKRLKHVRRTAAEEAEFKELQRLFDLRRSYRRWLRTGDANSPLFDEAKLRRLEEEDARRSRDE